MGVTTTIYSVEPGMMKKVEEDNENLAYITGDCEENENWEVASFDFDSGVDTYINIFFNAGAKESRKLIDSGYAELGLFDFNGYDIWAIPPSAVEIMQDELEALTPAMEDKIISDNLVDNHETEVMKIKDRRGTVLPGDAIRGYLDDIEKFKEFLYKAKEQKNYLIVIEG
ncbi:MAG: hypothetical protein QM687_06315 [Ferruginibacter sp.]